MKKRKSIYKILAFLLSVTMLPFVLPMQNANAASTTVFTEDFQGFEPGVLCAATTEKIIGQIGKLYYELYPGDKLEIVQEENGNKYLKFTRGSESSSNSYVMYAFPQAYTGGILSVAYDYKPEAHSLYFSRFGTIASSAHGVGATWAVDKKIIQQIISYSDNIYTSSTTNSNYWIGGMNNISKYSGDEWAVVTQTIDFALTSNNYKFNAKLKNAGTRIGGKTTTVNTADVNSIVWAIKKNDIAAWNGFYNKGDDPLYNSSIYRIDNITVSADGINVTGSNVANESEISANEEVEITFDEAVSNNATDHISIYKNGVLSDLGDYTVNFSTDRKTLTVSSFQYASEYDIKIAKTLKTQDGTKSMLENYTLNFTTNSIIDHDIIRPKYEIGYVPEVNPLSGISYEYSISKDDGAYEEYNLTALNATGAYFLKIVATDGNGKEEVAIIEFQIVGAVEPEITGLGISYTGTLQAGTELIGEYTYFDENDDADENMDYCVFKWYRSDKEGSGYEPIGGASGESYTLTSQDQNKYIKFSVKPFSTVAPFEGEEHFSEPVISFMTPEATNISISGKMAIGEELTVNYDYSDLNGDVEITEGTNATTVVWKISDTPDGEFTQIGSGRTYTLEETDLNKWIKVEVTPKNNGSGDQNRVFTSYIVKIVETSSGELLTEDFENYEVGVIHEATEYKKANVGNIHYELYTGDKVEIAQENGNKYLKFTRSSEDAGNSYVMYEFKEAYKDAVLSVSYDYRPELHSLCFSRFGTLVSSSHGIGTNWQSSNPVIQQIISYSDNIYIHSGTNADYWLGGINKVSNYATKECATITQTVDLDSTSNNYKFDAKYINSEGTYSNIGSKTKTVSTDDVNAIVWAVYKNGTGSWNGPDTGASVYRIDNIKVKSEGMRVVGVDIGNEDAVVVTFDDVLADSADDYISVFKDGVKSNSDEYALTLSSDKKKVSISGFDYYTDYSIEISKNLVSESGKKIVGGFETEFRTESIINHGINREKYSMGYIPAVNPLRGVDYTYSISKDGAEYQEYALEAIEEIGKYELKIVAVDENEKSQTMTIAFEIVGAMEPEISNIFINETGTPDIGTVLHGEAVYFDINDIVPDINKDYCDFQWYRSDKKYGEYTPISGANSENYTLTAADQDKYIKFGAKPFSKVEPYEGEEALSEPFMSFMSPEATNISIKGKMATDEQLTAYYEHSDLNGDTEITEGENATIVIWYTADTLDGSYTEIGRGQNYTLKDTDENKLIKIAVIPKNNGGGIQDKSFESKAVEGAFAPAVSSIGITGNLNVGSTVGVDYRFYDANLDIENGSVIEWYVNGMLVSKNAYYTIVSKDEGKPIYVTVTPKTAIKPTTGVTVKSETYKVSKNTNDIRPSVSSGGGGGGGATGGTSPKPENSGNTTPDTSKGFTDTNGHWAEQAIEKMVEQGIIYGKSAKNFAPEDKITRAEFATLISRMLGLAEKEYEFNDVKTENWYSKTVASVAAAGYMSGFNGNFRPEDNMTREEMAVVLFAIISEKQITSDAEAISFADELEISDWAKDAVNAMTKIGIINGMGDNKFSPSGEATRAQTVIMLTRLQDVLAH